MTAFTLGEATALAIDRLGAQSGVSSRGVQRTPASVLRGSVEAGTFEESFFAPPARGETDRLLRLARGALDAGRRLKRAAWTEGRTLSAAERSLVALTASAVRVYEELLTLARLNAGRVFPSYEHLARVTALGRATVARALPLLEMAGFLERRRRFRRVEGTGQGPRYAQTSNVYRPREPTRVLGLLPRWLRPAPVPVDVLQHADQGAIDLQGMQASLSCAELANTTIGGSLGRMLARLGARIDDVERESHDDPKTLTSSITAENTTAGACLRRPLITRRYARTHSRTPTRQ